MRRLLVTGLLVLVSLSTAVNAAAGAPLYATMSAGKYDDDSADITYTGSNWTDGTNASDYSGTSHRASGTCTNDYATFRVAAEQHVHIVYRGQSDSTYLDVYTSANGSSGWTRRLDENTYRSTTTYQIESGEIQTTDTYYKVCTDTSTNPKIFFDAVIVSTNPTNTPTPTITNTATSTSTSTATATWTATATATSTSTSTSTTVPATATYTPTATSTSTDTATPTATQPPTAGPSPTPTDTPTITPTPTDTATPTIGPSPTASNTPLPPTATPLTTPTRIMDDIIELSDGGGLIVEHRFTYGEIAIVVMLALLAAIAMMWILYEVSRQWFR